MKRTLCNISPLPGGKIIFILTLWLAYSSAGFAQSALQSGFSNPPPDAKPETFWAWLNSNVSKTGITADLEAMKRVGIQKAIVFNVDMGLPEGKATYLSAQWLHLFYFAATEAQRLGMQLSFHNGPGWSSSGGPWVKPEDAMQTIVYSIVQIKDGHIPDQPIPQPPSRLSYYKDIAVLAFPALQQDQRLDNPAKKSLSGNLFTNNAEPDTRLIPEGAVIKKGSLIDLTSRLSADGTLHWQPPAGNWTVVRIGHTPTGVENRPATESGRGLECDKMSSRAVDHYWNAGIQPILTRLGPLTGKVLTDCFIDSYEVGATNWTPLFRAEFKKRRGYDCFGYLPVFAGFYVESGDITERFLWDFRKTVSDLIVENYYGHFRTLCRQSNMQLIVEPYGGPFPSHEAGAKANSVMGEFWLDKNPFLESPKLAASIAHVNGMPVAGAEAFTGFGGWKNYPATMKPVGDRVWTEGINRFTFHVYTHQPFSIAPGLTYGRYGVEMNRANTWWEQSKPYMNYLSKSQYLLQQGRSVADVLVFTGESRCNNATLREDIKRKGYDYDQIGMDGLEKLRVKDGKMYTENSGPYSVLVLPQTDWATPELLQKLKQLTDHQAIVAGQKPTKCPSLTHYPQCDEQVTALAGELWSGNIRERSSAEDICRLLEKQNLAPDFSTGVTGRDLHFIHRAIGSDDLFFVANPAAHSRTERCSFRVAGKKPELWDAETGHISDIPVWHERGDGITEIPVSFTAHGAVFILFRSVAAIKEHIVSINEDLVNSPAPPLTGLQIIKAHYGSFLPDGIADVTSVLSARIAANGLRISADNGLAADPAPGSMKELRMEYEVHGERRRLVVLESEQKDLTQDSAGFRLIRAVYGKFRNDSGDIPSFPAVYDVTATLQTLIHSGRTSFTVSGNLFGVPADSATGSNELRVTYSLNNEAQETRTPDQQIAVFAQPLPDAKFISNNGNLVWLTPRPGKLHYTTSAGKKRTVAVEHVPNTIALTGPWNVSFPIKDARTKTIRFDRLISWTDSDDNDIRYFSGTAVYRKTITLNADIIHEDLPIELDLGNVQVMAEVIVNGKNLGILWKAPFSVNLGAAIHAGFNTLEVRVTNLWPNSLIGDERFTDDGVQKVNGQQQWPDWLVVAGARRTSERKYFTTRRYFTAQSKLLPSGLSGPVSLRFYRKRIINLDR